VTTAVEPTAQQGGLGGTRGAVDLSRAAPRLSAAMHVSMSIGPDDEFLSCLACIKLIEPTNQID
jgi:hypothetical protein